MRTIIFVFIMSAISTTIMHSQVLTRHLTSKQSMEEVIPFPINENYPVYLQPEVDFDKVLEQDALEGSTIPRFAVKVEQNYTVKDGKQWQIGNMLIWQIGFSAPHASSLNFLISGLNLPEGAEMFILSKDGRIIHGPITGDVIYDHVYASDIIESQDVLMVVKCKKDKFQKFSIDIIGVCQGIPKPLETRDFGDAEDCNFDVNCPHGAGWENERDAVALVLKNGSWWCSGSLINNQCQDLRSYFLTAFHCFDSDHNGSLSISEKDLSIYSFRFKYEAGTPMCPGNSTGDQGNWVTYSGAAFKSASFNSDFALAELNGNIKDQPRIALAGWDRRTNTPSGSVCIHHPAGDSKKFSRDFEPCNISSWNGIDNHWVSVFEQGTVQHGSSGSPLLDMNHRIVGQLHGDQLNQEDFCNQRRGEYGRFDVSWTGNNSDDTRLSTWLGPVNPPQTLNTIRVPSINSGSTSSFLICTTNKQIALSNAIPGRTITWSVNNTY
ncbi:MAG: trypsin-like peptidase domain-containing protein, partial [Saprospiraceae bacterium]|nr:trypsin-like peptidase domain-containing protein [Saprospiraceae bacterium]